MMVAICIDENNLELIDYYIDKIYINKNIFCVTNKSYEKNFNYLFYAIFKNNITITKYLIDNKINVNNIYEDYYDNIIFALHVIVLYALHANCIK